MDDFKHLVIGICVIIVVAFVGIGLCFSLVFWLCDNEVPVNATVEAPIVNCDCPRPAPCATGDGIVADGYNVNIVLDGQKWTPPALLSDEEKGYVTVCRKEDPELVHHPDLSFTKTYKLWHECLDELADARSGFEDEANQCCWQQEGF